MNLANLFKGIAVIIDDEIDDKKANINKLVRQIKGKKIPCLTYNEIPDNSIVEHLNGISFLLFDWKYIDKDIEDVKQKGVKIPATLAEENIEKNISFLKALREKCFVPIFIFSNEQKGKIEEALEQHGLYEKNKQNYIFVKRKSDLINGKKMFTEINKWLQKTPSIYTLKQWENEYRRTKNSLFHDFYEMSPNWPIILWRAFTEDGVDESSGLGDIVTRNLYTRMMPHSFDKKILNKQRKKIPKKEIRNVLEGERFIKAECLDGEGPATGDIFYGKIPVDGNGINSYWINIRAQCSLLRNRNPILYCLKGTPINEATIGKKNGVPFENGQFIEKISHEIVACIHNGRFIEFKFHTLKTENWNKIKCKRIGRLLPPYISRIQQRYALYMHRHAILRIPQKAI